MADVIAEVGGTTSNSYITVEEADAYFGDSFGKGLWAQAAASDQEALVITSSRTLDQYISWFGDKTNQAQSMEWPRTGVYDKTGRLYPSTTIPSTIKFAAYELAYYMLQNGGISFQEQNIDSVKVGPVEVDFTERSTDAGIPKFIESLLAMFGSPILAGSGAVAMVPLIRS